MERVKDGRGERKRFPTLLPVIAAVALALFLVVNGMIKSNHDESQYAAAAVLSADLLIYRDFMSGQSPLHAWVFAPLAQVFASWTFLAMRMATALMAFGTVVLVYIIQRRLAVPVRLALFACLGLVCCNAFLFGAGLIRNDILPALLGTGGLLLLCRPQGSFANRLAAGLLFGLAVSTKLSWAPMALAAFAFLLFTERRALAPLVLGGLIGGVPLLVGLLAAPANFIYGVYELGATAPHDWYKRNGLEGALDLPSKVKALLTAGLAGPAVLTGVIVMWDWVRHRRDLSRERWLLLAFCVGGVAAALIPTPAHDQYLIPLLPPLFTAFGLALRDLPATTRWAVMALTLAFAAWGLAETARQVRGNLREGWTVLEIREGAMWMREQVRAHGGTGTVATLSPQMVVDSGMPIDPRFAVGPFVYRSGHLLTPERARSLNVMIPALLDADFRPLAILTGHEPAWTAAVGSPDATLIAYARANGYEERPIPGSVGTLWLRPRSASIDSAPIE